MKKAAVCLLLLFAVHGFAQDLRTFAIENHSETDGLDKRPLKGKIKSIKTLYNEGILNADKKVYEDLHQLHNDGKGIYEAFDTSGRLVEYANITEPAYVPIDDYDKLIITYDANGKLRKKSIYGGYQVFNPYGDVVEYTNMSNDTIKDNTSYKYNSKGKKTEAYDAAAEEKSTYKYDTNGNLSEVTVYGGVVTIMAMPGPQKDKPARQLYTYDEQNRLLTIRTDNPQGFFGGTNFSVTYTYGQGKYPIKSVINNPDGTITETDYADGRIIKKTKRDNRGEKQVSTYSYENDSQGNWIKLTIDTIASSQKNGTRHLHGVIAEKEIEYYE